MALAMVMMQKAMKGNVRAFEQISKLTTTDVKDSLDKAEQKERIKTQKMKNKMLEENDGRESVIETVVFMNEANIPD
jgi:hypothetical protein